MKLAGWVVAGVLVVAGCADFERGPATPRPDAAVAAGGQSGAAPVDAGAVGGGGGASPGTGGAAGSPAPSFATTVYPLIERDCADCHRQGGMAQNTGLFLQGDAAAVRSTVLPLVDQRDPAQSRIVAKATGNGHMTIWAPGSPEVVALEAWIVGGTLP